MKLSALTLSLCLWLILLAIVMCAHAQWEEIPDAGLTVDLGGTANTKASALTGQSIYAGERGWAGVQISQITAAGEVITQNLDARVQSGFDVLGEVSVQGFIAAERDMQSALTTATGAYFRKVVEFGRLDFILGIGSFVEREQLRSELGLDKTAPTVLPYWLWSVSTAYDFRDNVGIFAQVIATPEGRFRHWRGTATLGMDIIIASNLTLKFQSTSTFRNDKATFEVDTENSIIFSYNR